MHALLGTGTLTAGRELAAPQSDIDLQRCYLTIIEQLFCPLDDHYSFFSISYVENYHLKAQNQFDPLQFGP